MINVIINIAVALFGAAIGFVLGRICNRLLQVKKPQQEKSSPEDHKRKDPQKLAADELNDRLASLQTMKFSPSHLHSNKR